MAAFTIYRSSDGSAPVLDGTVGSLVALLDACLVTGYGAKAAAGWTKPFTGTNKAAFKLGAGTGFYLRVQDDGPGAGGAAEARVTGYVTMSDVDTGTGPFPTAAQGLGGAIAALSFRKSSAADAAARSWIVVADSRTVYVFVLTTDFANVYLAFAFGDIYSFKSDDAYNCIIIAGNAEVNTASFLGDASLTISGTTAGHFIARGHTQLGASVAIGKHTDGAKSGGNTYAIGVIPFTNPEDGGIYVAPFWVHDPTTAPVNGVRGRLRGLWTPLHPTNSIPDATTFSGSAIGELTGKTFLAITFIRSASAIGGTLIIETSATLETN